MTEKHNDFTYEIIKPFSVLSKDTKGFRKEVNLISYNGKEPVVDIRTWTPQNTMSKGITLSVEAFETLLSMGEEILLEGKKERA